jgi:hypothetical protein
MQLSIRDKCWLVANIKRVFVGPSAFIFFMMGMVYMQHEKTLPPFFTIVGILGTIVLVITGFYAVKFAYQIAKFAEANFDEVVSRRIKWRTSNVELHEMKYRFMWETFGWALFSMYAPIFAIVWLIGYEINV